MTQTTTPLLSGSTTPHRELALPFKLTWVALALGLIVLLAAGLRLYNLQSVGEANTYYTAAIKAMTQSFHNFFFAAAEPGGSVTVDKPPLGLWLQAISALIFGVNGVAVVLPQVVAGILCVPILFTLVRRYFGVVAGLVAAFVLAVTPVAIAVERNNTMDATLVLTLLLATFALLRATDTGKLRWLLLGAVLVGLGFNIKMLEAFLPLPAFYTLYLFGAKIGLRRKVIHLVVATLVLVAVSFSWATVVQLTPADQRPYIGSTTSNSVFELIFGYNGLNRLIGGIGGGDRSGNPPAIPPATNGFQPPANSQNDDANARPDGGFQGPPGGLGGMFNTGTAGPLRLVTSPLANEVGWLLPFGLFSVALLIFGSRLRFPLTEKHKAAVLWGGWLLTATVFFSIAGFFHPYYLVMLAPPLAALVGIGATLLWNGARTRGRLLRIVIVALCAGLLAFQVFTASKYVDNVAWAIPAAVILAAGAVLLMLRRDVIRYTAIGFACLLLAGVWVPTVWASLTSIDTNASSALPEAYAGTKTQERFPVGNMMAETGRESVNPVMLNYLQANTKDVKFMLAVGSSMQGTGYVLATGRPVLYMGGFSGGDPVVDADKIAQLVTKGELRYVLGGGGFGPGGGKADVTAWLQANCKVVPTADYGGATDNGGGGFRGFGGGSLYECGVAS